MNRNTDPTHVYFNVRIQNGDPNGSDKVCEYREQRTVPLVDNPSEYYFSCIRFNIPTSHIPLLIVPIQPFPNTDVHKTIYSVALSYGGYTAQQYVMWSPNEASLKKSNIISPRLPLTSMNPYVNANDSYFYCRSYVHMMNLVNKALTDAFNDLFAHTTLPVGTQAPFFTYEPATKLFTLHAQEAMYDVNNSSPIDIYFNNDLFTLFGAFNHIKINNSSNEMDNKILVTAFPDNSNVDSSGTILFTQEYSTVVSWIGFQSIVITSGTIPIESEGIPSALPYFSNSNLQNTGQPTFLNIVSDFDALLDVGAQDFQTSMQYAPSGEYRLIDMKGTQPLTSFDIQAMWTDAFGGLHPIMIGPNESASFKFIFRKKSFNHSF